MNVCRYGPIGCFVEAFGSLIVTLLVALATICLQLFFNCRQERLSKERLRRDFYERRYGVWESTQELGQLLMNPTLIKDPAEFWLQGRKLLNRIESANFLFDDDALLLSINEFREKAGEVLLRIHRSRVTNRSPGFIKRDNSVGNRELTDATIGDEAAKLTNQFQNTLKITDKL